MTRAAELGRSETGTEGEFEEGTVTERESGGRRCPRRTWRPMVGGIGADDAEIEQDRDQDSQPIPS
jgi:hypothetical protein